MANMCPWLENSNHHLLIRTNRYSLHLKNALKFTFKLWCYLTTSKVLTLASIRNLHWNINLLPIFYVLVRWQLIGQIIGTPHAIKHWHLFSINGKVLGWKGKLFCVFQFSIHSTHTSIDLSFIQQTVWFIKKKISSINVMTHFFAYKQLKMVCARRHELPVKRRRVSQKGSFVKWYYVLLLKSHLWLNDWVLNWLPSIIIRK